MILAALGLLAGATLVVIGVVARVAGLDVVDGVSLATVLPGIGVFFLLVGAALVPLLA